MKFFRIIFLLSFLLCLFPASGKAQQIPKPQAFVNDFAGVIDAGSAQAIEQLTESFRRTAQVEIAVATIPSLDGYPIEDYSVKMAREWGIGAGELKEGVLILVSVGDRRMRVEISRRLEGALPDGLAGAIAEEMRPYFRQQQYGAGLLVACRRIVATIAKEKGISFSEVDPREAYSSRPPVRRSTGSYGLGSLLKLLFAIIVIILVLFRSSGRGGGGGLLTAIVLSNLFGSSRGSFGGGGGSSGDGGWGGFGGGGDFGGGGASSDW